MTSTPAVRAVLFDLGGVVCRFEPAPRLARLAELAHLEPSEVQARVWDAGLPREFDRGRYTTDEFKRAVCEGLGIDLDSDTFEDVMLSALTIDHDTIEVVDAIERERVRVAMLTDNPPLLFDALPRRFPELLRRFDPMLFSYQLRLLKPSREIFTAALARLGCAASEVLFVDDTAQNVGAAAALGLQAVRFTDATTLRGDLERAGVLRA